MGIRDGWQGSPPMRPGAGTEEEGGDIADKFGGRCSPTGQHKDKSGLVDWRESRQLRIQTAHMGFGGYL